MNKISGREGGSGDGTAVHHKTAWRDPSYEWIDVRSHDDARPQYVRGMQHRPVQYLGIGSWQPATIAWKPDPLQWKPDPLQDGWLIASGRDGTIRHKPDPDHTPPLAALLPPSFFDPFNMEI